MDLRNKRNLEEQVLYNAQRIDDIVNNPVDLSDYAEKEYVDDKTKDLASVEYVDDKTKDLATVNYVDGSVTGLVATSEMEDYVAETKPRLYRHNIVMAIYSNPPRTQFEETESDLVEIINKLDSEDNSLYADYNEIRSMRLDFNYIDNNPNPVTTYDGFPNIGNIIGSCTIGGVNIPEFDEKELFLDGLVRLGTWETPGLAGTDYLDIEGVLPDTVHGNLAWISTDTDYMFSAVGRDESKFHLEDTVVEITAPYVAEQATARTAVKRTKKKKA